MPSDTASGVAETPLAPPESAVERKSWWRLRRTDLAALAVWGGSRVVVLVISLAALAAQHGTSWLGLWQRWDWDRYLTIAEYGYTSGKGPAFDQNIVAFFPGYPAVLRAVHFMVRDWAVSGLLISLVAGAVACAALARLTEFEWHSRRAKGGNGDNNEARAGDADPRRAAVIAVLLLVCAPSAVFLAAGYTEALFLAFGIPAWLAARRRRWVLACVLTGLACTVRIDGGFEAAGIGIMFLLSRPKAREWAKLPAFAIPLAAVGGYFAYLDDIKGSWLAWFTAEKQGWQRQLTNPVTAFKNSWQQAFGSGGPMMGGFGGARKGGRRFGGFGMRHGGGFAGKPGSLPGGAVGGKAGNMTGGMPGGAGSASGGSPGGMASGGGTVSGHRFPGGGFGRLGGVGTMDAWPYRLDILMVFIGLAFAGWAIVRRRWAELTYVGLAVVSLATSTYYMSVGRDALLWWPLMIAVALWLSTRRRWVTGLCAGVSGLMMIGFCWLFLTGSWAG